MVAVFGTDMIYYLNEVVICLYLYIPGELVNLSDKYDVYGLVAGLYCHYYFAFVNQILLFTK